MKIIFSFLLLIPMISYASITGIWTGEGIAKTPKSQIECHDIELRFFHGKENKTLTFRGGHYNCTNLSAEYPYNVFQIKGNRLHQYGKEVGYFFENHLILENEEAGYELIIRKHENAIEMTERWIDGTDYFIVTGKLHK